jgi:acetate kinase
MPAMSDAGRRTARISPRGVLALNGGSSSIKFAFFGPGLVQEAQGAIERIGTREATFSADGARKARVPAGGPGAAARFLADWIDRHIGAVRIAAIGHRLVHGGPRHWKPTAVTPALLRDLRAFAPVDPDHLPGELELIGAFRRRFGGVPQVACFDTAFHHGLPRVAQLLALPRAYFDQGVRRYGFHGISYEYLMGELARLAGPAAARGRVILAHLGSGASLAAVRDGKPVDTSMGFTPAAGVPMATRSGDLDPGLVRYLAKAKGFSAERFNRFVNSECGLLGVSGTTGDMRALLKRERSDPRAADAVAFFCYHVRKTVGSYAAALGGVDTLVFSGGIGEHAAAVRSRVCQGLGFLGIRIREAKNATHAALISAPGSPVQVRVIPTDEAWIVARSTTRLLRLGR